MNNNMNKLNKTKNHWGTYLFLIIMFFFIDSHSISISGRSNSDIDKDVSRAEDGSIDRRIGLLCLLGFSVYAIAKNKNKHIKIKGMGWLIIIFLSWALYSLAWSDNFSITLRRIIVLLILFFISFAMTRHFSIQNFITWIFWATIGYAFLSLFSEIALLKFNPFSHEYRFAGTLHPNHQGINCGLLLISGVYLIGKGQKFKKLIIAILIIAAILLFLTKSRTAFISTLMALGLFGVVRLSFKYKLAAILIAIILTCTLLLLVGDALFPAFQNAMMMGREQETKNVYSLTGRVPLWKICFKYISKRPIQGYGYGAFWTEKTIREISASEKWTIGESHCAYIELALGLGLIGLFFYVCMLIGGAIQAGYKYKKSLNIDYLIFSLVLIFCIVDGVLESGIVFPGMLMFICISIFMYLGFQDEPPKKGVFKK